MTLRDKIIKNIEEINPIAIFKKRKMRARLKKNSISFFTPNCLGGLLFHELGLQFKSPTVNLMLSQTDFAKFVLNLDDYLKYPLSFFEKEGMECPCAYLNDIVIHFTHYTSDEDAEHKWIARTKRIDYENMYVFVQERDGLSEEKIMELGNLSVKGLVVFTAHDYPDIPWTVYLPQYEQDGEVGNILKRNIIDNSREYERCFDFVSWFNEANGYPFDVSKYINRKR